VLPDLGVFRQRFRVVPGEVVEDLAVRLQRPVRRPCTSDGLRLAGGEQILTDVLRREVVTCRQACLEEELRTVGLGDDLSAYADPEVTGALEDVHPR
jgi:hypothetical protein